MKKIKMTQSVLFSLRLFFYLSVVLLLLLHPAIVIPFDRVGLLKWFFIIPFASLVAFLPSLKGKSVNKLLTALVPVLVFSLWAGGFSSAALPPFFAGLAAFVLTSLLFHYPRWAKLSLAEPFLFAWVCFRLLTFSRSSEEAAGFSSGLTQFILVWTAVVFLLHSVIVYLCLYPGSASGLKKEGTVFTFSSLAALSLVVFLLPADFVRNTVVDNLLPDQRERLTRPTDDDWGIPDGPGRQGRRTLPGSKDGRQPSLRGLSEHNWPGRRGRGGEGGSSNQQFTVMVVASRYEPVYMADAIRGRLDPVQGFVPFPDELMSRLSAQRFFVTWFDNEPVFNRDRERQEVFSLSTLPWKYLPYRPTSIDPTILSDNSGPFRYIHRNVSNVHINDPLDLLSVPIRHDLNSSERRRLAPYLELPLAEPDRLIFEAHLNRIRLSWAQQRDRIMGAAPLENAVWEISAAYLSRIRQAWEESLWLFQELPLEGASGNVFNARLERARISWEEGLNDFFRLPLDETDENSEAYEAGGEALAAHFQSLLDEWEESRRMFVALHVFDETSRAILNIDLDHIKAVLSANLDSISLSWEEDRRTFSRGTELMETILAILLSFSAFQYNVNTNNYSTIADMIEFITGTMEGDCVEFSNTAALLGRLAGIPSRVATGFLAAAGLQTPAHQRGLAALQSRIPILQEFPFEELFLVTDAHGHSWTQFYIPEFGWLDFEPTAFAIPPMGLGDGNLRDVVIPLFDQNRLFAPVRAFPWQPVLRSLAFMALLALAAAYALRYGREAALGLRVRRGGSAGARSLYLLLLARLAADGKPIKPVSKTAPEYAQLFAGVGQASTFAPFAELYTELRWRHFSDKAEMERVFALLQNEYRKILEENRRSGVPAFFARIFSLRGLAYF
ncbi:MAG: transglutaminase-like domain-containing protein [Treponema sp.]|jgi:hypothetical protein|nr:transglutaminase-like domain-containing protein [Treponema sp.]